MMCARLENPAQIIALDIDDHRLRLASEQGLANKTINPSQLSPEMIEAVVRLLTHGRGADCVIEAAGGKEYV